MNLVKPAKIIDLKKDLAFKIYFKGSKTVLKSLLQHFLPLPEGDQIEDVEVLDSEANPLALKPEEKNFVLDLKVRICRKEGITETVNVEMQSSAYTHFTDRLLAYASRLYTGQIEEGQDYDQLYPVYSLSFCAENLKEFASITNEYYHLCTIRREDSDPSRQPLLSRGMQFVVVELKKFSKTTAEELVDFRENWCYLLKKGPHISGAEFDTICEKGEEMGNAVKRLWNLSEDDYIREQMEAIEKQRRDQVARENDARAEGMEKGMEKGRVEGMEKGMEKGRVEGMEKGRVEVARQMLGKGLDISTICECTGLTEDEVKALKK